MERNEVCKLCGQEFEGSKFGRHLRSHKVVMADYYHEHYPKTELLTGDRMDFRDRESYFLHDFNSRRNLITFLTTNRESKYSKYPIELLARHAKFRGFKFQPSQVELRASILPARNFYESRFDSYAHVCSSIGLRARFEEQPVITLPPLPNDFEIWYDTREQTPLAFPCTTRRVKLDFGDYTTAGKLFTGVFIERKSVTDLVNTISQHFERFQAEIERAKTQQSYLVVLVEESFDAVSRFSIPQSRATPVFIFHRIKLLMQTFDNIQFVFADGREQASQLITEILLMGDRARTVDLQYALERKQLCGKSTAAKK